jgi:aminopeptidase N
MKRILGVLTLALGLCGARASGQVLPGHRLPEGPDRPVRERSFHIEKYVADLRFDMAKEEITGTATITFQSLRDPLPRLSLDAARLDIQKVERDGRALEFQIDPKTSKWKLDIALGEPVAAGKSATVRIAYACRPKVGMYFFPAAHGRSPQAWNYGEGGLHNGWLPIYNDTNDRFAVEFVVTVPKGYTAVSNGVLEPPKENADGTRTFRWVQEKPIPNYLMTVDVAELIRVPLADATVTPGSARVPLAVWTPPGTEKAAQLTFGDTPKMVEFFSQRMGYPYPWAKYDQVVLSDFAVGAMETTTATGFGESHVHGEGDPPDSAPDFGEAWPVFTVEDTISHELAHHWFGDLVTCRSIGSIWLNESFATFWHTIWNGHAHGEDDLTYQRWWYLNKYVDYVRRSGAVRPMEFLRYTEPTAMYQTELTYVKGSLVLHMIRHFLGDDDFYRMIAGYLARHQFSSVESADLEEAIELGAGHDLSWFFRDWVVGGGGHPRFDVSYRWVPERRQVDLTVKQIQSDLPFENDFRLPVDVEVVDASGAAAVHRVELSGWETTVALPAASRPRRVTFDEGGWLVGEVKYDRPIGEVLDELDHAGLANRLRAARQLADDFGRDPTAVAALARTLADPAAHWGLRQEAALDLGRAGGADAARALEKALASDANPRVRRAVAIGLGECGHASSAAALRRAIESDRAEDVIGASAISLGRLGGAGTKDYLVRQLSRPSRWWDSIRVSALMGLGKLRDASLAPVFAPYTDAQYVQDVRAAAVAAWADAAPDDPRLAEALRRLSSDRNRTIRVDAVKRLGALHHEADLPLLRELAGDPDPTIAFFANEGVEGTEKFVRK